MTSPDYRPPPSPGWWVKSNNPIFVPEGTLTFAGGAPVLTQGGVISPSTGSISFTGSAPTVTVGPTITPPSGTITWAGGVPGRGDAINIPSGTLSFTGGAPLVGSQYFDDFNRADSSSSLGANWTNRLNSMGIIGNAAYPTSNSPAFATYNAAMVYDDMAVAVTLGVGAAGASKLQLVIGANASGESASLDMNGNGQWRIMTKSSWAGETSRASVGGQTWNAGDSIVFGRIGNSYGVQLNTVGVPGLFWVDSSNITPRDSSHRLWGIGGEQYLGNYRTIDFIQATNL